MTAEHQTPGAQPDVRRRGGDDAYQDACENVPFASIGGLGGRADPRAPAYVLPEDRAAYLEGYVERCREMFGADWRICAFGWAPAVILGGRPPGSEDAPRD